MSGSPTATNQLASVVNEILKGLIEGTGVASAVAAAVVAYPVLGWPVISQIFVWFATLIAGDIYEQAAHAATKIVIDLQVAEETSAATNAFFSLQMAIASGDPNAITQASKDLTAAYASLVHSDGSAPA